ncbi:hypothetical protein H257_18739 [Aphanomyces astaci]|uniref:Uncharacterized protein n=1 Tax=Aphanomyces astaci TaxID=112090 RepID=W4FA26_APHAT|nr:hypothetical protein H257_18739 [Aphanomyces astaci]ETV64355.1 hypothetical protein H257_18739 [Aphanomyces astaci]|eukprot:XP_009846162.1 hypothetical protein H257_18739 [Aphanomyces astaci]
MGWLHRASNPFDFLLYHPHHKSKWLMLWELHSLWINVWRQWSATLMDGRIQLPHFSATIMSLPVWLTTFERSMSNGKCAASIVNSPTTRRWCSHGALNQLRCLADIVAVHGRWPTRAEFMAMMSDRNPAAQVEIGMDGRMQWATVCRSGMLYNHLTCVHTNVLGLNQPPPPATPAPPTARHPFYGLAKDAPVHHAPIHEGHHPMSSTARATTAAIHSYVKRVRRTCRIPPPVQGDVWLRLLFRMLPVNCRFAHLQPSFHSGGGSLPKDFMTFVKMARPRPLLLCVVCGTSTATMEQSPRLNLLPTGQLTHHGSHAQLKTLH